MTREIKFRAWHPTQGMGFTPILQRSDYSGKVYCHGYDKDGSLLNLDLMQFTGLKDKNGIEIYEGDIVYLAGFGNYQVEFPFIELYEAGAENDIGQILGNIYQNPELLESK